jgi:type I restriction enzyme S subunit
VGNKETKRPRYENWKRVHPVGRKRIIQRVWSTFNQINEHLFLNDEQAEKLKNVAVKADDVLLNITGASIGRVATAPRDMEGARVNQHVCIIRPTSEITPKFLELVLASPVVQNLIDAIQVGATREALTKAMIEQFEIPVPSLAEQHRIVAKVDQLMALVDELERQQAASREKASNLLDAIVHEMTSGG